MREEKEQIHEGLYPADGLIHVADRDGVKGWERGPK